MMSKNTLEPPEKERSTQEHKAIAVSSDNAAVRDTWRNIRLIIGREYNNQVTRRSFIISSIILLALVAIAAFIPTIVQLIDERTNAQTHVVVVNNAGTIASLDETTLASYINSALNGTNTSGKTPYAVTIQPSADLGDLQSQVKNGKLAILLVLERASNQALHLTYYNNTSTPNDSNLPKIQVLASQLTFLDTAYHLGLTPTQTSSLFAPPDLSVVCTQGNRPENEIVAGYVLAFAGAYLSFMAVAAYANNVALGVAEEKSSRVMEILVNTATPFQLLVGKIVGIGAACLAQMGCLVVVGIGALLLQTPLQAALFGANAGGFSQYLASISIPFYFLFLVYFLLNFLLYATLFAGLGAMVKRQDEVQSAIQVPMMLLVSGWILVYLGAAFPNATWFKVLSYIPFFTTELMLVRIGLGAVAWWEIVATIAIMLVAISACAWFSARAYRLGVLMYGQRPGLRQLMKMVRTK